MSKKKIAIISDFFLPGFKSGGGMRTVANTVRSLSNEFDFFIVTRDHDGFGDTKPYDGIEYGTWNQIGKAKVRYLRPSEINPRVIADSIAECNPDAVYMNSIFSTLSVYFLVVRMLGFVGRFPSGVAACGELTPGALSQRRLKKSLFLTLSRIVGLHRNVLWRATDEIESESIDKRFSTKDILIAPDISVPISETSKRTDKTVGVLNLLFFSRIVPMKNLEFLFSILHSVDGEVNLKIIGPHEDSEYLSKLEQLAANPSPGKTFTFLGPMSQEEISNHISDADFFVLPSLGENFGHVIVEAMAAGCPVLISDRTPWCSLEERLAGFDIPLEDEKRWIRTIEDLISIDREKYQAFCVGAKEFGNRIISDSDARQRSLEYFEALTEFGRP